MVADNRALGDAMWWAFITFTTVGYGDQYPDSTAGRIAGAILVTSSVFMVIPTITAVIVSKIIGDKDEFTHEEQEELKTLVREIHQNVTKASQ
jgi:voltage-gated potassium channel